MADKNIKRIFSSNENKADLTDVEDFTYSAFLRKMRKKLEKQEFLSFLKIYKIEFDKSVALKLEDAERVSLTKSLIIFNKTIRPIKIDKEIIKNAAVAELGTPEEVGEYLAGIVSFLMKRISPDSRSRSIENLKDKFNKLDVFTMSNKKMPVSSALGQAISFTKQVLFGHDARYIKLVINSIVKNI